MKSLTSHTLSILTLAATAALVGCSHVPTPMEEVAINKDIGIEAKSKRAVNGTILRDYKDFALFEDAIPSRVGDTVLVMIKEKTDASKKSRTSTARTNDLSMSGPNIKGVPGLNDFTGMSVDSKSNNKFSGGGETSAANIFTGNIVTTVGEVLPNGYLVVNGTKQINIHNELETLHFKGIVNPKYIMADGSVSSQYVAEVRVRYSGKGQIDESQFMGWLGRIFLSVLPI